MKKKVFFVSLILISSFFALAVYSNSCDVAYRSCMDDCQKYKDTNSYGSLEFSKCQRACVATYQSCYPTD